MAIEESNYNFVAIDVGARGSSAVSQVLRKSPMGNKILKGRFTIPRTLIENGDPFPHVVVADDAFDLSTSIMKPFPKQVLNMKRKIFNYCLAQDFGERSFGILSNNCEFLEVLYYH